MMLTFSSVDDYEFNLYFKCSTIIGMFSVEYFKNILKIKSILLLPSLIVFRPNIGTEKKWDIEDLKTICYALSVNLPYINRCPFIDKKPSYIEHLKRWLN